MLITACRYVFVRVRPSFLNVWPPFWNIFQVSDADGLAKTLLVCSLFSIFVFIRLTFVVVALTFPVFAIFTFA